MTILDKAPNYEDSIGCNQGEIEELWKFDSQLGVKLYKFETKDQNTKGVEIWGLNWSYAGLQLHKIKSLKSIRGLMKNKSQIKGKKWNWPKQRCFCVNCSFSSLEKLLELPTF